MSEADRRYYQKHKERIKAATNKYYKSHRDSICAKQAERNLSIKKLVLTKYGNGACSCVTCGFDDIDCLTIDHTNNDGHWHRDVIDKPSGNVFYKWLVTNNFPEGYQTLCANCNLKKEIERKRNRRGDNHVKIG